MRNTSPIVLIAASIIALVGLGVTAIVAFFVLNAWFGVSVLAQAPDQPIDFPHTVHAGAVEDGGIGLDCTFCHRNVTEGAAATVPSVEQCMFCHSQVIRHNCPGAAGDSQADLGGGSREPPSTGNESTGCLTT